MDLRSYTKQELALLYFPDATPAVASAHLMRWIQRNPARRSGGFAIRRQKRLDLFPCGFAIRLKRECCIDFGELLQF